MNSLEVFCTTLMSSQLIRLTVKGQLLRTASRDTSLIDTLSAIIVPYGQY